MLDSDQYKKALNELTRLLEPIVASRPRLPAPKFRVVEEHESESVLAEQYTAQAQAIANRLLSEALAKGVPQLSSRVDLSELSGGAASDFVFRARTQMSFVVKVQRDPKLKSEALWLASLRPDVLDATPWGALFPRVLSQHLDRAPYAYAMEDFRKEDGYRDLAAWIFDGELLPEARDVQARGLLQKALETLSKVYRSSKDTNSRTTLDSEAYLKRIKGRMEQAQNMFQGFSAASVTIDDASFQSWKAYVELIEAKRNTVEAFFPSFETAVHGDAHPGNIIVRLVRNESTGDYETEVRLIDPKGWTHGDYVFDFAKIGHYLEVTGPVERLGAGASFKYENEANRLILTGRPFLPDWITKLSDAVEGHVSSLGKTLGDESASRRYPLAMASCLLGTVPLRWENGQKDLAVLMYGEGLRWLSAFCEGIDKS